jgi:hypothetical protein
MDKQGDESSATAKLVLVERVSKAGKPGVVQKSTIPAPLVGVRLNATTLVGYHRVRRQVLLVVGSNPALKDVDCLGMLHVNGDCFLLHI